MANLYKQAIDYLSRREYSTFELRQRLKSFGSDEEVDSLLTSLAKKGLQSNARYTENYVRHRINAGFGPLRIRQELQHRGIEDDLVSQFVSEEEEVWWENLQRVWQKKYHGQLDNINQKEYARQVRFLAQRGFAHDMIIRFLNLTTG